MKQALHILATAALLLWPSVASAQMVVHSVSVTTDASGDATVYSPPTFGTVVAIRYVPHATTPLDGTADITVTDNGTGLPILTITNTAIVARTWFPRAFVVSTTGADALFAASGTNVLDLVPVAGAIKAVIAQGGNAKSGTLYFYVQGR